MIKKIIEITPSDDGKRLDRVVRQLFPALPYDWVQKAFRKKDIRLDGKKADPKANVVAGQKLHIHYPDQFDVSEKQCTSENQRSRWREELQSMLLYEDEDVYVFNKPRGLAVQGGSGVSRSLDQMLEALTHPSKGRPKLVHRLDRDTSGVILVARTAAMARQLTNDFKEKNIQKIYHAYVVGKPKKREGTITFPLGKVRRGGVEKVEVVEDGQEAVTHYKLLHTKKGVSLLELEPVTGRMHQLRVHCAEIGCPILGDKKYGGEKAIVKNWPDHLHLHAYAVHFKDVDGCSVNVEAK